MTRRFIDIDLFKDPFIRGLEAPLKTLFIYLFCDCNSSGIWNVELDVAKLRCGIEMDYPDNKIMDAFSSKIVVLDGGTKWFIPSFIKIQYNNELKIKNPATKKVIFDLNSYNLIEEKEPNIFVIKQSPLEAPLKPLFKIKKGAKDMDKEKEKDMDKEKEEKEETFSKKNDKKIEIEFPWDSKDFEDTWKQWKIYKHKQFGFKYKAVETEQAALVKLSNLAENNEQTAKMIIKESIAQGWKGFFAIKKDLPAAEKFKNDSVSQYNNKI